MPRFDGTGPMGMGPMTGRRGGCFVSNKEEERKNLNRKYEILKQEIVLIEERMKKLV